jgi:hypothetical protein
MTAKKEQTTEWSSKDKIVWSKPSTYNKHKKIYPKFQYGTAPWKEGEYYIEQYVGVNTYSVYFHIWGYDSVREGHVPSQTEMLLYGKSLKECKAYLANLISKMYEAKEVSLRKDII